ncbi:hypothetical protein [Butyrivibrio sp. INlla16]|nr:hypothetical protein [Butyrivibrio sp. INlla16]SDB64478.1 hypothetical protein SAMN02910263_03596 [Butyrivibrio sp. INlla16]
MGKKKVEHVVFDGMREIKKKYNISEYNKKSHADKRKRTATMHVKDPKQ